MRLPDPRRLPPDVRQQIAWRARSAYDARDFTAQITEFNSAPCPRHRMGPNEGARAMAAAALVPGPGPMGRAQAIVPAAPGGGPKSAAEAMLGAALPVPGGPTQRAEAMVGTALPVPGCSDCGVLLRRHQRVGVAWLWFVMRGMLADGCGLGKTAQVAGVLAAAVQVGELTLQNRAVIVCQAAAVRQWAAELRRLVPALQVITADGTPEDRMRAYLGGWTVAVVSDRTLAPAGSPGKRGYRDGDVERLRQFPVGIVVYDDIDAMRNGATKTAWAVKRLSQGADRVYGAHATPLQKRLTELYCQMEPVGAMRVFGTKSRFSNRYVSKSRLLVWISVSRATPAEKNQWARQAGFGGLAQLLAQAQSDRAAGVEPSGSAALRMSIALQAGRARYQRTVWKDSGVKEQYLPEFKRLLAPMVLRRTVRDLDDVELPAVQENTVWLDLLPAQRQRYGELAQGILTRLRESGTEITRIQAVAAHTRARQICSGLAALDDAGFTGEGRAQTGGAGQTAGGRPPGFGEEAQRTLGGQDASGLLPGDVSVKLDWTVDRITGDFADDKVMCFVYFRPNVEALSRRLTQEGVGHVLLWSEETDPAERARRIERFTNDPDCRVVIATSTAERSLNLQAASHLIAVDTIPNPARMTQILGRVRRMGSRHDMVLFHQLLARDTYEEDLPGMLRAEQAMSDAVWDDTGELFTASLTPRQVLESIARRAA